MDYADLSPARRSDGFEIRSKQDCKSFFAHPGEADYKSAIPKMVEHSLCRIANPAGRLADFKVLMIILSFYPPGSHVQLMRILAQIPEIHQPEDILLFIVKIDNLEVLHDEGPTILSPFLQFRYKRITLRHQPQLMFHTNQAINPLFGCFSAEFQQSVIYTFVKFAIKQIICLYLHCAIFCSNLAIKSSTG